MPLTAERNVPHTASDVIDCADGGHVVGAITEDSGAANLCVQDRTRACMACAALSQGEWSALRDLADEMVRRLALQTQTGQEP